MAVQRAIRSLFLQSILLESSVECTVTDTQFLCGFLTIAIVTFEGFLEHLLANGVEIEVFGLFLGLDVFFGLSILEGRSDGGDRLDGLDGRGECRRGF